MDECKAKPVILLRGSKHYILLHSNDHFHLINVDKQMTEELEEKLYQIYPCGEEKMREMGLHFSNIPKSSLLGVCIEGNTAGCEFAMRVSGQNTRRYELSDDLPQGQLEAMFEGVRQLPPPRNSATDAWRKKEQDPETLKEMKQLHRWLIGLTVVSCAGYILKLPLYTLWTILCVLIPSFCIFLAVRYQEYFTILNLEKNKSPKHAIDLTFLTMFPLLFLVLRIAKYNYLSYWKLLVWTILITAAVGVLLWIFLREAKRLKGSFAAMLLILACGNMGVVGTLNTMLDNSPEQLHYYTVEELHIDDGGRSTEYECVITLDNGERFVLSVSNSEYSKLAVGERIVVVHRSGGLGLEYLYLAEE